MAIVKKAEEGWYKDSSSKWGLWGMENTHVWMEKIEAKLFRLRMEISVSTDDLVQIEITPTT